MENPLPVMVWIHGGGWLLGSGNYETGFYGPGYLLDRNIILVTINYRLGALGTALRVRSSRSLHAIIFINSN